MGDSISIFPKLLIIRGLPGSGKSTLGNKYAAEYNYVHLEADNFHFNSEGKYVFEEVNASKSHDWCRLNAEYNIRIGKRVVVSNTFIKNIHIVQYYEIAKNYNCTFDVISMMNNFGNIHEVPTDTLQLMKDNFEEYSLERVKSYSLVERFGFDDGLCEK